MACINPNGNVNLNQNGDDGNARRIVDYNHVVNVVNTMQPAVSSLKETVSTLTVNEKRLYLYFQLLTWINMFHGMAKFYLRTETDAIIAHNRNVNIVNLEHNIDKLKDDLLAMIECIRLP